MEYTSIKFQGFADALAIGMGQFSEKMVYLYRTPDWIWFGITAFEFETLLRERLRTDGVMCSIIEMD